MENSTEIPLDFPITVNGAEVKSLSMRRPKVADVRTAENFKGSEAEREIRLMANLCDVAPKDIESLDMVDYDKLQEAFKSFRGRK